MTEDPQRFAEEFNIAIQTYQFGFSNLHQLVHMLVGEDQAKHWVKLAKREHPGGDLETQTPNFSQDVRKLARNFHQAITLAFPKPAETNRIQVSSQKSDELLHNYYN